MSSGGVPLAHVLSVVLAAPVVTWVSASQLRLDLPVPPVHLWTSAIRKFQIERSAVYCNGGSATAVIFETPGMTGPLMESELSITLSGDITPRTIVNASFRVRTVANNTKGMWSPASSRISNPYVDCTVMSTYSVTSSLPSTVSSGQAHYPVYAVLLVVVLFVLSRKNSMP